MSETIRLKKINYAGRVVPILMQNENGPCPLLSLCNILLLKGEINLHTDYSEVSLDLLIHLITNHLLEANPTTADAVANVKALRAKQIDDLIKLLPRLSTGLDVNVRFTGVESFEYTEELSAFDTFDVRLVHGWVIDYQDEATVQAINSLTYNQLVEKLVNYRSSIEEGKTQGKSSISPPSSSPSASPPQASPSLPLDQRQEGHLIEEFLSATAGQLTVYGLAQLHNRLLEGELCAFFRNNHFSVLHKREGHLYLLVTDLGYLKEPRLIWERFDEVSGDSEFVDAQFISTGPLLSSPSANPNALPYEAQKLSREELELQAAIRLSAKEAAAAAAEAKDAEQEPALSAVVEGEGSPMMANPLGGGAAESLSQVYPLPNDHEDPAETDYLMALRLQKDEEDALGHERASLLLAQQLSTDGDDNSTCTTSTGPSSTTTTTTTRGPSPSTFTALNDSNKRSRNVSPEQVEEEAYLRHYYGSGGGAELEGGATPHFAQDEGLVLEGADVDFTRPIAFAELDGDGEERRHSAEPPVLHNYEAQRPYTEAELEAMRRQERVFRQAKEKKDRQMIGRRGTRTTSGSKCAVQ